MIAKHLISTVIPSVKTSDTGREALQLMEFYRISHLPIVNHLDFLGLISETDIYDQNRPDEAIGSYQLSLFSPFAYEEQHIYEIIALASQLKLSVIPVLSETKEYLGCITQFDLVQQFSKLAAVGQAGTVIVLEMVPVDYSLAHISRIIENDDVKILSCYVHTPEGSNKLHVTIKLNTTNSGPVIATLERFNYQIIQLFNEDNELNDVLEHRYAEFMKYLNM
ncbi:MAG: CBS domain-containing protein [Bacteroidales bacterium]|nr:CBS domain-containing protein [Bacteroidales bacterium]